MVKRGRVGRHVSAEKDDRESKRYEMRQKNSKKHGQKREATKSTHPATPFRALDHVNFVQSQRTAAGELVGRRG